MLPYQIAFLKVQICMCSLQLLDNLTHDVIPFIADLFTEVATVLGYIDYH